jgi:aspartyl-tRNA(Asn)/glutamyl-tRNA(Gln) amidotransferase subunit C
MRRNDRPDMFDGLDLRACHVGIDLTSQGPGRSGIPRARHRRTSYSHEVLDTIDPVSTFTRRDVEHLASLARLELTDDETALFTRQLSDILEFVREIQAVESSTLEPTTDAGARALGLRDDAVQPSLDRGEVLGASPEADAASGLFKVPRVLNG